MSAWDKSKQLVTCWCLTFFFYFPSQKLIYVLMQASVVVFVSSVLPVCRILWKRCSV